MRDETRERDGDGRRDGETDGERQRRRDGEMDGRTETEKQRQKWSPETEREYTE